MPAVAARTTYPIVSALPKLGIPTIRSALPTRRTSASPCSSSADAGGADGLDASVNLLGPCPFVRLGRSG
jgi:hypothetical protein